MTTYETFTLILQVLVAVAAFVTMAIYYRQLGVMSEQLTAMHVSSRSQGALAIVNFLQSAEVRAARHCVRESLSKKPLEQWCDEDRRNASVVTANYDVVAGLLKANLAPSELIVANWGPSIAHCYQVLAPYIEEMRAKPGAKCAYWSNFEWLNEQVNSVPVGPVPPADRVQG